MSAQPPDHDSDPQNPDADQPEVEVQAVVDRLEEGMEDSLYAVLLLGDAEEELILPAHRMPRGAGPGSWLRLRMQGERVINVNLDEETTAARRASVQAKRAQLRARPRRFTPRKRE